MTSRERMLAVLNHQIPDRVPCCPDLSNMVPARLTGKPFWDIYLYQTPSLFDAYINMLKYFPIDGWYAGYWSSSGHPFFTNTNKNDKREFISKIIERNPDSIVTLETMKSPEGELWREVVYRKYDVPVTRRNYIKNFKEDLKHLRYFFPNPSNTDDTLFQVNKKRMGDLGVFGDAIPLPGLHDIIGLMDKGLQQATYAYYDNHDLILEYAEMQKNWVKKIVERVLRTKPDFIHIGAAGLLTLQGPEIFRELSLPTLKMVTKMAKEANIPSMLHACGKSKYLVKVCYEETNLDLIEPLEEPPMGDINLKEAKRKYNDKLSLKGNVHCIEVLLNGIPEEVEAACKRCIDDAAEGGGFVLSSADQPGRDTPDENIFKMIEVAENYGRY